MSQGLEEASRKWLISIIRDLNWMEGRLRAPERFEATINDRVNESCDLILTKQGSRLPFCLNRDALTMNSRVTSDALITRSINSVLKLIPHGQISIKLLRYHA